jgi:hypothetical protein
LKQRTRVYRDRLPANLYDDLWDSFKRAIEPLQASAKLGAVFYQLPRLGLSV